MDLNVIFVQKGKKKKKIACRKQNFSNADASGDALPR